MKIPEEKGGEKERQEVRAVRVEFRCRRIKSG